MPRECRWKWEDIGRGTQYRAQAVHTRIVDRDMETPLGKISAPSGGVRYWERMVVE